MLVVTIILISTKTSVAKSEVQKFWSKVIREAGFEELQITGYIVKLVVEVFKFSEGFETSLAIAVPNIGNYRFIFEP